MNYALELILFCFAMLVTFIVTRKYPCSTTRVEISTNAIKHELACWYLQHTWECVNVIDDYPGIFGTPTRVIVLECKYERIRMCWNADNIHVGTKVMLRLLNPGEISPGVWVSTVDRYMIPVIGTKTAN